jgi:hypothetical protein
MIVACMYPGKLLGKKDFKASIAGMIVCRNSHWI